MKRYFDASSTRRERIVAVTGRASLTAKQAERWPLLWPLLRPSKPCQRLSDDDTVSSPKTSLTQWSTRVDGADELCAPRRRNSPLASIFQLRERCLGGRRLASRFPRRDSELPVSPGTSRHKSCRTHL